MTPTTNQEPPISDPLVMIGGKTYTVVFDLRASYKLSEWDLDPDEVMAVLWNWQAVKDADGNPVKNENGTPKLQLKAGKKWLFYVINLFAACVAHNYAELGEAAPTGDQWTARLAAIENGLGIVSKALYEAMGKHFLARIPRPPQPAVTTEASQPAVN
jgi:hypothetical protein